MATDNRQSSAALFAVGALIVTVALGALIATRSPNDISESIQMQQAEGAGLGNGADRAATSGSSSSDDPAEESAPSGLSEECIELAQIDPSGVSITFENGELALTIDGEVIDLGTLRDCLPDDLGALLDGDGLTDPFNLPGLEDLPDFAEDFELPDGFLDNGSGVFDLDGIDPCEFFAGGLGSFPDGFTFDPGFLENFGDILSEEQLEQLQEQLGEAFEGPDGTPLFPPEGLIPPEGATPWCDRLVPD